MLDSTFIPSYTSAPIFSLTDKKKETAAQANGRRYEEKVGAYLQNWCHIHNYEFKDHPWICYFAAGGRSLYCQPDFILLSNSDDNLIIIEAKLRHTRDAIGQLKRYRELIRVIHPTFTPSLVEICRYFDSSECRLELISSLKPHSKEVVAMVFEPREWTHTVN